MAGTDFDGLTRAWIQPGSSRRRLLHRVAGGAISTGVAAVGGRDRARAAKLGCCDRLEREAEAACRRKTPPDDIGQCRVETAHCRSLDGGGCELTHVRCASSRGPCR